MPQHCSIFYFLRGAGLQAFHNPFSVFLQTILPHGIEPIAWIWCTVAKPSAACFSLWWSCFASKLPMSTRHPVFSDVSCHWWKTPQGRLFYLTAAFRASKYASNSMYLDSRCLHLNHPIHEATTMRHLISKYWLCHSLLFKDKSQHLTFNSFFCQFYASRKSSNSSSTGRGRNSQFPSTRPSSL